MYFRLQVEIDLKYIFCFLSCMVFRLGPQHLITYEENKIKTHTMETYNICW